MNNHVLGAPVPGGRKGHGHHHDDGDCCSDRHRYRSHVAGQGYGQGTVALGLVVGEASLREALRGASLRIRYLGLALALRFYNTVAATIVAATTAKATTRAAAGTAPEP